MPLFKRDKKSKPVGKPPAAREIPAQAPEIAEALRFMVENGESFITLTEVNSGALLQFESASGPIFDLGFGSRANDLLFERAERFVKARGGMVIDAGTIKACRVELPAGDYEGAAKLALEAFMELYDLKGNFTLRVDYGRW